MNLSYDKPFIGGEWVAPSSSAIEPFATALDARGTEMARRTSAHFGPVVSVGPEGLASYQSVQSVYLQA
ncbi:hypothetical protein [Pseudonocardia alaniniphila]|uniref:Aldehyde dehydrogenase family protein n=1 Tax=Pseudonocardia alaniniphila TaxID=75291 RepID=A0ABS9TCW5_9PSEU|nr:hypothetical protein [Pseudonocardia alaniniphila]MCH6166377.1 hypothetical protein [Pseudonocardia alaniniphila]